jgi:hypothetical protein
MLLKTTTLYVQSLELLQAIGRGYRRPTKSLMIYLRNLISVEHIAKTIKMFHNVFNRLSRQNPIFDFPKNNKNTMTKLINLLESVLNYLKAKRKRESPKIDFSNLSENAKKLQQLVYLEDQERLAFKNIDKLNEFKKSAHNCHVNIHYYSFYAQGTLYFEKKFIEQVIDLAIDSSVSELERLRKEISELG